MWKQAFKNAGLEKSPAYFYFLRIKIESSRIATEERLIRKPTSVAKGAD